MKLPVVKEGLNLVKFFLVFALAGYVLGKFEKFFYFLALCSLLLAGFLVYFFRDPERIITRDENVILSPADGRIMEITEVRGEEKFIHGNPRDDLSPLKRDLREKSAAIRVQVIKIFMSPFNVHIQRAPVSGKVVNIEYKKGKFLPAQKSEASEKNEQNLISIEHRPARQDLAGGAKSGEQRVESKEQRAKSEEGFIRGNQRDLEKSAAICVTVKQIAGIIARRIICWTKTGVQLTQGEKIGMIALGSQVDLYLPQEVNLKVKVGDKVKAGLTVIASFNTDYHG